MIGLTVARLRRATTEQSNVNLLIERILLGHESSQISRLTHSFRVRLLVARFKDTVLLTTSCQGTIRHCEMLRRCVAWSSKIPKMCAMRIVGVIAFLAINLSSCEAYTPELVSREVTTPSASYPRLHHVANFASDFEMDHIIKTSFQHMK